ncbi:MAG: group II truncated hemoglobin [Sphingomonadales bacterium]|nr:group II truncated hemoglobin [Sphingomonadales bacterium]MDE2171424.1 group II truncated hemoglobin [Sphingomonadales bacterium]
MAEPSLYDAIGGAPTISALVDRFYTNMELWPEARAIRAMHGDDLAGVAHGLKAYLSEWLGGPALFSPVKGHPRMKMRHMPFPIASAERDAWLACMKEALDTVVTNRAARIQIYASMEKLADWMRNRPDPV